MITRCKPLLGTFVEIKVDQQNHLADKAVNDAFNEIGTIHNQMSFFEENSEISKLNCQAYIKPIRVDMRIFEILNFAKNISQISAGTFDITAHRSPKDQEISFNDIELLENSCVRFKKDLQIDLGGIAKGYAVDKAADILEDRGITDYIINAGGDLQVGKTLQKIGIRNPHDISSIICNADICEGSLATSSGYFSAYEINNNGLKKRVYPVFKKNPKKFEALEYENESASVFAKDCITADALTKIVLILKDDCRKILKHFDARAVMVSK